MSDDFDMTASRVVWIPVQFDGLASAGTSLATAVKHEIEVLVDLPDMDEYGRLFVSPVDDKGRPREKARPPATPERIEEWKKIDDMTRALALVKDWRRVKAGGKVVPFSAEALANMMRVPNFPLGFFTAYHSAYAGIPDTREGNFDGSPAGGAASEKAE